MQVTYQVRVVGMAEGGGGGDGSGSVGCHRGVLPHWLGRQLLVQKLVTHCYSDLES